MPEMDPQQKAADDPASHHRVVARLEGFAELDSDDIAFLAGMASAPRILKRGARIRGDDASATMLHFLIDGWAASAVSLASGSRQLNAVGLPGDMLGLPSLAVCEPIDEVVALSQVIVCDIAVESIGRLFAERPRLAALLFLVSQEERVFAMERLALLGQAPAKTRLAALFLRLYERVRQLEGKAKARFFMPLTQQDMGDLIGVTAVHVNALMKDLRTSGLVAVKSREIHIADFDGLRDLAGIAQWRRSQPSWLPGPRAE